MSYKKVPAIERTFGILSLLASDGDGLRFSAIQERTRIPKASLSRILYQLVEEEYLQKNNETGKYTLGPKLVLLGHAFLERLDIRDKAKPILQELANKTKETAELAILNKRRILYIDKYESSESIRLIADVGSQYATLHASAVGKVFLSYMSEDDFNIFLKNVGLVKITEKTITNAETLHQECERIKKEGVAFDDEECRIRVSRIAAPVFNYSNELTAVVGIAGPTFRMRDTGKEKLGQIVKEAAEKISHRIGYKRRNVM